MLLNIFKLLLTFSSTSLFIAIFLIKSHVSLEKWSSHLTEYPSYFLYFSGVVLLNLITLLLLRFLEEDSLGGQGDQGGESGIKEIELANQSFLPTYLGYFFVALSIADKDYMTFIIVYLVVFIFTLYSQTNYFNPMFVLLGYQFYYVLTLNNVRIFLITKKLMKDPSVYKFDKLKRINDFTFIDGGKKL